MIGLVGRGLDEVADALYAAQPQEFVAGRDAAVAEAKADGDAALAGAIAKLRKPTVGAWLVNQLALKRPDAVRDLLDLGDSLREAQRRLKGEQLRQLAAQRRAVIGALVGQAQELAVAAQPGTSPAKLPLTEVEATLTAALADDEIAEQVRTGRLVKTVSYAGFGDLTALGDDGDESADAGSEPGKAARNAPREGREATGREARKRREAQEREARKELEAGRRAEGEAREEFEASGAAQAETADRLARFEEEIEELERQRDAARKELQQARSAQKAAQRALQAASRRVAQAEAALE